MLVLPIIVALATNATAQIPDGFTAHCVDGKGSSVFFREADVAHPTLDPPRPNSDNVALMHQNGQFLVVITGADYDIVQTNDHDFSLTVLKDEPGDLALSVQTSTNGRSLTVYHLRYAGNDGALTIARTSYYGYGADDTSLSLLSCKIGSQTSP